MARSIVGSFTAEKQLDNTYYIYYTAYQHYSKVIEKVGVRGCNVDRVITTLYNQKLNEAAL